MNYIEKNLNKDERIIFNCKTTLTPFISDLLPVILLYLFDKLFLSESVSYLIVEKTLDIEIIKSLMLIFLIGFLISIGKVIINYLSINLVLTNKRVIGKKGMLSITSLDAPINKINDIHIKQTFMGRILNYSSIIISTSSSKYVFPNIANGTGFKNLLIEYMNNIVEQTENTNNNLDQIRQLKELLDMKAITEEEFENKKKELLNIK